MFWTFKSKYFRQRAASLIIKANLSKIYFRTLKSKNSDNCVWIFRNFTVYNQKIISRYRGSLILHVAFYDILTILYLLISISIPSSSLLHMRALVLAFRNSVRPMRGRDNFPLVSRRVVTRCT